MEQTETAKNNRGTGEDRADPDVFDENHGRRNARAFTWDLSPAGRQAAANKLLAWLNKGRENPDGTFTQLGPRTWAVLFGKLAEINAQNMKDQHHLEGQKVNLGVTMNKPPDEEARELLAEMRRGDLKPRAN